MRLPNRIRGFQEERGQILLLAALLLTVFIGLVGLAVDAGFLYAQRRQAQNGADAAALAGAQRLWEGGSQGQAIAAAFSYAHDNGYGASQTQVNLLPGAEPTAVEVIVEEQPTSFFIHVLIPGANTVRARAVADTVNIPREYGLIVLNQDVCSGYDQGGSGDVLINGAGAMINSDCDDALDKGGNSLFNADGDIDVTGGVDEPYSGIDPDPRDYVPWTLDDPLAALEPPDPAAYPTQNGTSASPDTLRINSSGNHTLPAGTYYGGVRINCSDCTITFETGVHIMAGGGFWIASNPVIQGDGVLIYVTDCNGPNDPSPDEPDGPPICSGDGRAAPFDFQGSAEINLTGLHYCAPFGPPCPPPYEDILITFWQDAAIDDQIRFAGDSGGSTGIWYFPSAELVATGGANFGTGQVIVGSFTKTGNGDVFITYEAFVEIDLPLVLLIE